MGQLKSLKVLDISYNNIRAESTAQFFDSILCHIKKLPKLKYLVSMGNTFEKLIPHYRLFIISELPKLTTLDLQPVLKEVSFISPFLNNKTKRHLFNSVLFLIRKEAERRNSQLWANGEEG